VLLVILLLSSFIYTFKGISPLVSGAVTSVGDDTELRDAINIAPTGLESYVIELTNDIELKTDPLTIPLDKNITLTSAGGLLYSLIGESNKATIVVEAGGILVLDEVIVTHKTGDYGRGIRVDSDGTLIMVSGEIYGNTNYDFSDSGGGGVFVAFGGLFNMFGGVIVNNTDRYGGGVCTYGTFDVSGINCVIANNTAIYLSGSGSGGDGGGVYNNGGIFTVSDVGCVIVNNTAISDNAADYVGGGGVYNTGGDFFVIGDDCVIANNTATTTRLFSSNLCGGGVHNNDGGNFIVTGKGCTIANNTVTGSDNSGGGVYNRDSTFTISGKDCIIANNTAGYVGGGVRNSDVGLFTISGNVMITNNTAGHGGGGVDNDNDCVFVMSDDCMITNNTATNSGSVGGGVYNLGNFTIVNGVIANNIAVTGGGVYNNAATNSAICNFTMLNGVIANNTATADGGGVYITEWYVSLPGSGIFTVSGGVIANNTATYRGGGVYTYFANFTLSGNSTIIGNKANYSGYGGGGVYNCYGNFTMSGEAMIANNTATSLGGGVYNDYRGSSSYRSNFIMFDETIVANNTAMYGGGVYTNGTFTMSGNSVIFGNTASTGGGGVYNNGNFTISNSCVIANNTSTTGSGGGVFNNVESSTNNYGFIMSGKAVVANNTASGNGGGVYTNGNFTLTNEAVVTNNTSNSASGSAGGGGGVSVFSGFFIMSDEAVVANNTVNGNSYGGGIYVSIFGIFMLSDEAVVTNNIANGSGFGGGVGSMGYFNMTGGVITNNTANGLSGGGGIYSGGSGSFNMLDGEIVNNTAPNGGGLTTSRTFMSGGVIANNTATIEGGGVYFQGSIPFNMTGGKIVNNTAHDGGGLSIFFGSTGNFIMSGGVIANNTAAEFGGGVYLTDFMSISYATFILTGDAIVANNTASWGGGISNNGNFTMLNGLISDNTAVNGGGVYGNSGANMTRLLGGKVSSNVAVNDGGGVWVTATNAIADFKRLFVADGVVFEENFAGNGWYNMDEPTYRSVYDEQVKSTVWTNGVTFGYNNFDISYTDGTPVFSDVYEVVYNPGHYGLWVAGDETYGGLHLGDFTPPCGVDPLVSHVVGWSFVGWNTTSGFVDATVLRNVTYTAQWRAWSNISYTVHYYLEDTTYSVIADRVVSDEVFGTFVTEFAVNVSGYSVVGPTILIAELNATDNVFVFYYTKDFVPTVSYVVHYYLVGSAVNVTDDKVVVGQTVGVSVTEFAAVVSGYTAVAPTSKTDTLNATYNVFVFYYVRNQGGDNNNGGGSSGSGGGSHTKPPTNTSPPSTTKPDTSPPSTTSPPSDGNDKVPLQTWALVNLILSVVGLILAIIVIIYALLKKKKKTQKQQQEPEKDIKRKNIVKFDDEQNNDVTQNQQQEKAQRRKLWLIAAFILGVVGIIVFLLTENMNNPMTIVDKWTIINAIIFIVEIISIIFTFKQPVKIEKYN
jgi:predicted outer membrane repeat protein